MCPLLRYHICTLVVYGCVRALWLYVRVDFLSGVLWWLAEATQTWPHLQHFHETSCLRLCFPFFLQHYSVFTHCLSDSVAAIHSLVLQREDFLSFSRSFTSFPDSSFFQTPKTSNPFPHSLYVPTAPPHFFPPKFLSTFPVSFFLSLSLCLVKGPTVRRPGSCGFHANRLSGRGYSKEPRARD